MKLSTGGDLSMNIITDGVIITGIWKRNTGRFSNGRTLYLKMFPVASVNYSASVGNTWDSYCMLPRSKPFGKLNHASFDQAKARAEVEVRSWLKHALQVENVQLETTMEDD